MYFYLMNNKDIINYHYYIESGLNLPFGAVVGAIVGSVVGSIFVSGFGQQHLLFLLQQENLSQHASVPLGQGEPLLMHLAPWFSLTQILRMPV